MVDIVFFDLGLTLVDSEGRPFTHVEEALETIRSFTTRQGKPLVLGLLSDFEMPEPPSTPKKIAVIFDRYLALLDATGLRPFFEPVERRVTLSAHAGALKPDRKIFTTALRRLRSKVPLKQCLFVTENGDHVRAARTKLGMRALQFRLADSPEFDFDDWLQAPPMIAHLVDPTGGPSGEAALRGYLRVAHTFDLHEIHRSKRTAATTVGGTLWRPVGERAGGDLADVQVPFTVEGVVERGAAGEITEVRFAEPEAAAVAEAASFVRSLSRHGEIGDSARERAPRAATHVIETDDHGRRRLLRKRFRTL